MIRPIAAALSALAAVAAISSAPAFADPAPAKPASVDPLPAGPAPPMITDRPVIYVVGDGDLKSPGVVIGVARELNKFSAGTGGNWNSSWVIPLPTATAVQAAAMCPTPEQAQSNEFPGRMLGFIDISLTYTLTDRFYILVSHDATHIYPFVQVVACPTFGEYPILAPTVVAAISQLSTANGTSWVISQSEVSMPLASYAGVAGFLSKKFSSSETNTILAAALSSATNYSIPGFSEGRRLQHATQRLADDVLGELLNYWCPRIRTPAPGAPASGALSPNGTAMCSVLAPSATALTAASPAP